MVAIYAHESEVPDQRYVYETPPQFVPAGSTVSPGPYEGYPVGFEFYVDTVLLKSCGETIRGYPFFADGFESGDFKAWTEVEP